MVDAGQLHIVCVCVQWYHMCCQMHVIMATCCNQCVAIEPWAHAKHESTAFVHGMKSLDPSLAWGLVALFPTQMTDINWYEFHQLVAYV